MELDAGHKQLFINTFPGFPYLPWLDHKFVSKHHTSSKQRKGPGLEGQLTLEQTVVVQSHMCVNMNCVR